MSSHENDNKPQAPDLASVLRILASLGPQNHPSQAPALSPAPQQAIQPPAQYYQPPPQQQWQQTPPPKSFTPPPQSQQQNPNPNVKVVDPATIVDWSAGLRCAMKTLARHENILHEVRRMIKVQHEHEEQWLNGRQALLERQKHRKEGQKKLEEVLKSVGGATATGATNTTPEELAEELKTFDVKVYKAQLQMVREMTQRLRTLGIPFFGTKAELIRPAGKEEAGMGNGEGPKGIIDELELVKLQRKMLALLEEMCND